MKGDMDTIKKVPLVMSKTVTGREKKKKKTFGFKWDANRGLNPDSPFNLFTRRSPAAVTHGFKTSNGVFLFLNYAAANANQRQHTLNIFLCSVCICLELCRLPTVKARAAKHGAFTRHKWEKCDI